MKILIIIFSILVVIYVFLEIDKRHNRNKLNKLIGQDLSSYSKKELIKLKDQYQRYDQDVGILYKTHIRKLWEEAGRIINEIFKRNFEEV